MTNDDVKLSPLLSSPVLQRLGDLKRFNSAVDVPTMEVWRRERTAAYGQSDLKPTGDGVEEELINGVVVKHYNWLLLLVSKSNFTYIDGSIIRDKILLCLWLLQGSSWWARIFEKRGSTFDFNGLRLWSKTLAPLPLLLLGRGLVISRPKALKC